MLERMVLRHVCVILKRSTGGYKYSDRTTDSRPLRRRAVYNPSGAPAPPRKVMDHCTRLPSHRPAKSDSRRRCTPPRD